MPKRSFHGTPFLPAWRHLLAPMNTPCAHLLRTVGSYTLSQLESCLGRWVPSQLFPKAQRQQNSRDRIYTPWRTFWCMLWQALNPDTSGREVVRQLQALLILENGPLISEEDGAYCEAKGRLPSGPLATALKATAKAADQPAPALSILRGRALHAVDGSALTLADTPKNRKNYPPLQCTDTPSMPMMRVVVLFSLISGAISVLAQGSLAISELALFASFMTHLTQGDILLGDRGFGCYPLIGMLRGQGIDFIGRTTRRIDGRQRRQRLGKNDWLMDWKRNPTPSPWLSALQWAGLPEQMTVRTLKGSLFQKGFRVRQVTLVTTLLDAQLYPAHEILQAYLRRWRLEMCLDDLKTTMKMDLLRGRSPAMVQKELHARLIAHNLIRCVVVQAAIEHAVPVERISFKGSLDALRQFSQALVQARTKKKRRELWDRLLGTLAADFVPLRPGRREPRALKRKKNRYPRLDVPRHKFKDHPKRNERRKKARLRRLGLI